MTAINKSHLSVEECLVGELTSPSAVFDSARYSSDLLRHGFAVVEGVIPTAEVERLRKVIAALGEGEEVLRKRQVYGVRNLLEICPAACDLAASAVVRRFVEPVLGETCFAVRAIFFDKVPEANWKLGWHQDSVISVRRRIDVAGFMAWSNKAGVWQVQPPAEVLARMLAIRVHLDDCHADNGPLRVLPGSHNAGWQEDRLEEWKQRVATVECHVATGGIVAMRPLLLHASSAAAQPTHRRVIHIEFAAHDLPNGLEWNTRVH